MSRYPQFDRAALSIKPLAERTHDLDLSCRLLPVDRLDNEAVFLRDDPGLRATATRMKQARREDRSVVFAMGAHVIRAGVVPQLIDLMERGFITHVAVNGAAVIHDYEFALIGQTTESVAKYISNGQFGLWRETGRINDLVSEGAAENLGLGELIGRAILNGDFPHKDASLFAAAYRLGVPATVHVGIGYDIVYEQPNCDGAAWGETSYRDFLIFTHAISRLERGAFLSFGSAVMAPEVYLKALAMARNVAHQSGTQIRDFVTLACDLIPIAGDPRRQAPKSDPQYYYRPYKTILVRTIADGGESHYVCGDHRHTLPALRSLLLAD